MKNTSKLFLLVTPLLGLFTVSCGDNFDSRKDGDPGLCVYDGILYEQGQQWKAVDGCNICVCGLDKPVVKCSFEKVCGDGGASDGAAVSDASSSDASFIDASFIDSGKKLGDAPQDVSVANDASVDAPSSSGDTRLASERD
jgi:hypothetical protein